MFCFGKTNEQLPCVSCSRGKRKDYGQWICSQDGFRPRPISQVKNCKSLNDYLKRKKSR